MIRRQKVLRYALIAAAVLVAVAVLAAVLFYVRNARANSVSGLLGGSVTQACETSDKGVKVCLAASKEHVASSEKLKLRITVFDPESSGSTSVVTEDGRGNAFDVMVKDTYTCFYEDSHLQVIQKDRLFGGDIIAGDRKCGAGFVDTFMKPTNSQVIMYDLIGARMKDGENKLRASYGFAKSGELSIYKQKASAEELARQLEACQGLRDHAGHDEIPEYCAMITATLKTPYPVTYVCSDWKEIFGRISLNVPCAELMGLGLGFIYVPRENAEKYLEKIRTLPELNEARIDKYF